MNHFNWHKIKRRVICKKKKEGRGYEKHVMMKYWVKKNVDLEKRVMSPWSPSSSSPHRNILTSNSHFPTKRKPDKSFHSEAFFPLLSRLVAAFSSFSSLPFWRSLLASLLGSCVDQDTTLLFFQSPGLVLLLQLLLSFLYCLCVSFCVSKTKPIVGPLINGDWSCGCCLLRCFISS